MTKKQRGPFTVVLLLVVNIEHISSEFFVVFCFFLLTFIPKIRLLSFACVTQAKTPFSSKPVE